MEVRKRPTAFVAMKFETDHWRDKRYLAIREELENAGFECIRGDELRTSGPVVDEVCRLLREAELVVIDSSNDSHNVSYEIGYCHGVGRSLESTLLLHSGNNLPFNYQHYRNRFYKDLRHLRRLVRDYLQLYEPLSDSQKGYIFTFGFLPDSYDYINDGLFCVLDALQKQVFTGRGEFYAAEQFLFRGYYFSIGCMLRRPSRHQITPSYKWWKELTGSIEEISKRYDGKIILEKHHSEFAEKRAFKAQLLSCGEAEFENGYITRILDIREESLLELYLDSKR